MAAVQSVFGLRQYIGVAIIICAAQCACAENEARRIMLARGYLEMTMADLG